MIVLDASVLIAHLNERDALHSEAVERLLAVAHEPLSCSPITLAQVLVGPARLGRLDDARAAIATLGVAQVPFAPDAATRLAVLWAETGFKLPDCCVLLAAETVRAAAVLTFDERLARATARVQPPRP